jgi:5-methylcytosine-specific restriction endonuclease McrA
MLKTCFKCKQDLPVDRFSTTGSGKDRKLRSYCKPCDAADIKLRRRVTKTDKGMCIYCFNPVKDKAIVCLPHYLRRIFSRNNSRDALKINTAQRNELVEKIISSMQPNGVCPYTGEKLVFGENVHLDHKIPISRAPELAYELNNLQLVSEEYNQAKGAKTDSEFLEFCKLILTRAGCIVIPPEG